MTFGADVGGTFTDVVRWDGRHLAVGKTSTTAAQSEGVLAALRSLATHDERLLHGTTVATNALLERRGARTLLLTDEGFADLIEIARQDRPSLYDPFADRPAPLVARDDRIEVARDQDPDPSIDTLAARSPEAIAIGLLHAYRDPSDEQRLAARVRARLDVPVSCSHAVVGEMREYERLSTTVLNAYLTPVVARYLEDLRAAAIGSGLVNEVEVLRSSGGLMSLEAAADLPAAILLSGPAGGVVAAAALGDRLGDRELVSFDMGGTSTDVCRIVDGRPEVGYERDIDGFACRLPSVAIHTVGAGGGSIAWVDAGGALRAGPASAGAWPGPACYGRGGERPTVTDANIVLGRIDPHARLAGQVPIDAAAARTAMARLGEPLGLGPVATARGVVAIVETVMARAVRVVSVEQGADPRDARLLSFGGAGGLHATALARQLGMAGVVVPAHAGVFSAFGLLLSPRRTDRARGARIVEADAGELAALATAVADEARAALGSPGPEVRVLVDARYVGQAHETTVVHDPGEPWHVLAARFHAAHAERNGFARTDDPVEIVAVRAEATVAPAVSLDEVPTFEPTGEARRGTRDVVVGDSETATAVWWRPGLAPGAEILGPAVIEEADATTFLGAGERARVHDTGALEIDW
jgi:N-methylhydantoinase A